MSSAAVWNRIYDVGQTRCAAKQFIVLDVDASLAKFQPALPIALANDSDFDPGGSVFTNDTERGKRVARHVDTGMMFINNISWSDAERGDMGTSKSS